MPIKHLNYYATLGISITASRDDIQAAYDRRLEDIQQPSRVINDLSHWDDSPPSSKLHAVTASEALQTLMTMARTPRSPPRHITGTPDSPTTDFQTLHEDPEDSVDGIVAINKLEDAFQILAHPVKKKAYDMTFRASLQAWELRRIGRAIPRYLSRGPAEAKARKWRRSLELGHDPNYDYDEAEFNRVDCLGRFESRELSLLTASMACGEVIASFIDGMDL